MIRDNDLQNRAVRHGDRADRSDYVSPEDIAIHWRVHVNTVYRDLRKGALPAFRLPGGRWRIRREDAIRYGKPHE